MDAEVRQERRESKAQPAGGGFKRCPECDDTAVVEAAQIPWPRLGELLVQSGLITDRELQEALTEQMRTDQRLGEILVARGVVSFRELTNALMEQLGREIAREKTIGSTPSAAIQRRVSREHPEERGSEDAEAPRAAMLSTPAVNRRDPAEILERTADALEIMASRIRSSLSAPA